MFDVWSRWTPKMNICLLDDCCSCLSPGHEISWVGHVVTQQQEYLQKWSDSVVHLTSQFVFRHSLGRKLRQTQEKSGVKSTHLPVQPFYWSLSNSKTIKSSGLKEGSRGPSEVNPSQGCICLTWKGNISHVLCVLFELECFHTFQLSCLWGTLPFYKSQILTSFPPDEFWT